MMSQVENIKQTPSGEVVENRLDEAEIKEDALRILEVFGLTDKQEEIYARIDSIMNKGLSEKEMLIEAFKILNGDEKLLISKIDEVLAQKEEMKRGRVA